MIEEGIDNKQKTWCVYMHTNIINNKKYIGITKKSPKKRWGCKGYGYKKSQPVFWNAIQKYGWDNFKHEILFNNLSQKEAQEKEIELIAKYKTNCRRYDSPEYGYNMTDGGEGMSGSFPTEKTREKIRASHRDRIKNETWEEREKRCQRMRGNANPFYGKKHTDKTKDKIGEKARERLRDKTKHPMYNKKQSEESKRKNFNSQKGKSPVIQFDLEGNFIAEYEGIIEAYRKTKISRTSISACCHHKAKTAGGFIWEFKNAEDINKKSLCKNCLAKRVVQLSMSGEVIKIFESLSDAGRQTKIHAQNIGACCSGKYKHSGGFKWLYEKDYEQLKRWNYGKEKDEEV